MREGFKETEIENIPKDWQIAVLSKIAKIYDGTHQTPKYTEEGIPFYTVEHLTSNDFSKTKFIHPKVFEKENERVTLEKGDILMSRIGDVGTARLIDWDVKASFYVSLALIKKGENVNGKYLVQFLNGTSFQKELWKRMIHVAFPKKINLGEIGKCKVILPPLPEQQKIADILSTVDEKIELIDQQIAETEALKKGLMQRLLTKGIGHTEFKDSPLGDIPKTWEIVELNEISDITRLAGYEYSEYWVEDEEGEIIALRGYNIGKNKIILRDTVKISNELSLQLNRSRLYKGDVIFPCVGTIGNAAVVEENDKFHINQNIAKITPHSNLDSQFLVQYLISSICKNEIRRFNATTSQPNVLVGSLRKFRIPFPTNISEQIAIAEILNTFDIKLEVSKEKKKHYQNLKKGLMQQLLTGKIRVNTLVEA